jgi:LCP family protein required for cell wall assembly
MLSIPRDLLTTISCPGFPQHIDRVNAAFSECGPLGSLLTVRTLTGLPINYLITVNFRGFLQLVDRIGGIWLDVDQRYFNNQTGPGGYSAIDLHPGYQKLTALQALAFVRFRHTDSDIYRTARQQLFLRSLEEQVSRSLSVSRLLDVVSAVEHNVTVGRAGGGGVTLRTLINYLYFAYTLPRGHLLQVRIQNFTGANTLSASQGDIDAAVQQFIRPDVRVRHRLLLKRRTAAPRQVSSSGFANVTANQGETLPTLRALQRRVPFRLMSPRLIERTSVPDPSEPVRQYTVVPGHQAVRLTFRAGAFDYWGIEETNWTGAPALNRPNLVRHFGRRKFDLYYSGGQLRMVVLRRGGATYWVVNSLLNALSNSTMLAIARSLVPLQR